MLLFVNTQNYNKIVKNSKIKLLIHKEYTLLKKKTIKLTYSYFKVNLNFKIVIPEKYHLNSILSTQNQEELFENRVNKINNNKTLTWNYKIFRQNQTHFLSNRI